MIKAETSLKRGLSMHLKKPLKIKNLLITILAASTLTLAFLAYAKPRIEVMHGFTLDGFARVKIINRIPVELACFVAIDGHKAKFKLNALAESKWYKATDKRFKYTDFHIWCDYLELHPEYNNR